VNESIRINTGTTEGFYNEFHQNLNLSLCKITV